jgi:DNA repair and recombination protein RAD54B
VSKHLSALKLRLITLIDSLGRKPFENLHLTQGLRTFVGGLEIEVDSRIAQSEFPKVIGKSIQTGDENDIQGSTDIGPSINHTVSVNSSSPIKNTTASGMRYIPPTTFYAKPAPKTNSTSPL